MDYNFLKDVNLVGSKFYNPEEYRTSGIMYTITDMTSNKIRFTWFDPYDKVDEIGTMPISSLIHFLDIEFYLLEIKDDDESFFDKIW